MIGLKNPSGMKGKIFCRVVRVGTFKAQPCAQKKNLFEMRSGEKHYNEWDKGCVMWIANQKLETSLITDESSKQKGMRERDSSGSNAGKTTDTQVGSTASNATADDQSDYQRFKKRKGVRKTRGQQGGGNCWGVMRKKGRKKRTGDIYGMKAIRRKTEKYRGGNEASGDWEKKKWKDTVRSKKHRKV